MKIVCDLHSDLLAYLAERDDRSIFDPMSRCSIDALRAGGVRTQVLPVYVPDSLRSPGSGLSQVSAFTAALREHSEDFVHLGADEEAGDRVSIGLAVENAAAFFGDEEDFETGIKRLERIHSSHGPIFYVSLTWALENRFGGGNSAQGVGLKSQGEALIARLVSMGIPIDMSHASDKLAFDILERVARRHTSAQLVASHCNFRAVKKHERNLSDEVALEVVSRGGVIGLNLIRGFVGDTIQDFARHYLHGLELGLEDALCLGADFFCPEDLPSKPSSSDDYFLPGFGTAACHPALQKTLLEAGVSTHQLGKLTNSNLDQWLGRLLAAHSSVAGH